MSVFPTPAEMAEFRAMAEDGMQDTCTVSYKTGETEQDEDTGQEVPVFAIRFTSPCKFQTQTLEATTPEAGGRQVALVRKQVHLPWGSPDIDVADIIECTAVGPSSDPALIGRKVRVTAPDPKTFATAVRLDVTEEL